MKWTRCLALSMVLAIALNANAQDDAPYCPDFNGRTPPELIAGEDGWLNVDGELSLASLRGHAVWLEFSFIACGGCQMMKPHLQGLQHRYGPSGLVVVEVSNGAVDTRDAVIEELARLQPNYPVLWDEGGRTCDAFGVTTYGAAYLIGADGTVVWGGNPIDLTVVDMWKLVNRAMGDVDASALREAGDPLLSRNPVADTPTAVASHPAANPEEVAIRYDLGWHFTICMDDNSMLIEGVRTNSPAALAGLAEGDTIFRINDLVLADVPFDTLKSALHAIEKSPDPVALGVRRGDAHISMTAAPAPRR